MFCLVFCEHVVNKKARLKAGFLAGDERIELPLRVLETPVMPFDQSPVSNVLNIYIMKMGGMSSVIFKINEI